ncbi:hypothetical protein [Prevotella melaninogenica]|nr:hypothetical protein [Prevotella melaninogenica]
MPAVTQPTTTDDKEQGRTTSTHTDTKAATQPASKQIDTQLYIIIY